jgi:anaerobic selenocysteine-containing dehydrogenase
MDRRNFFKIVSSVSAGAATIACEKQKSDALIPLLVPDHEIVPGEEQWHPSICTSCDAGCGTIVRVMRGERVIVRKGEKFREQLACIKKIEGNPLDSVSGGRLCARGHAALQSLYNPDRLREPMRRTGARGKAEFTAISWDDAIAAVSEKLAKVHSSDPGRILFLTSALPGTRSLSIQHFLESLGAPPAASCSVSSVALERKAAELVFGWQGVPRYDLANARYALGVGADFLGGWVSPVYYARQYGQFRQGRAGLRGKLVQAESRMSLTAASADEWLPVRPGTEPQLLIAIARLLLDEKQVRFIEKQPANLIESLKTANLDDVIRATGLREKNLRRIVHELGESEAPLVIAGASIVQTNSLDALIAAHYVNMLLGNIGRSGGVLSPSFPAVSVAPDKNLPQALKRAQIVFLDSENPVYSYGASSELTRAFANIETIVSFGTFIDDSVAYADLILPDNHSLESESAVVPPVAGTQLAFAVTAPFVRPLYNTRPIEQTLASLTQKLNVSYTAVTAKGLIEPSLQPGETWDAVLEQGGLWRDNGSDGQATVTTASPKLTWPEAVFSGPPDHFPLQFQPYVSLQYHDGRDANLPWMQELPDPASSSMWGLPVEIDPQTAAHLNIGTGDWVRVESPVGALEAQAYVHPAALPGVIGMAIGEGHTNYGRYASSVGANPLSIVAPVWEQATGALAFGATRVRVTRLDRRPAELIQFSPSDREQGPWGYR